jgi:hypothetical protein
MFDVAGDTFVVHRTIAMTCSVDIYSNLFFLTIDFWSMCEDSDCDVCR